MAEVRLADDPVALAALRTAWASGDDPAFADRMAAWLESEGDRRTTWLAWEGTDPVGMASMFEYRRMPKPGRPPSRWGYVSNLYVRGDARGRGVASALLDAIIATADERDYARLVLSPSGEALGLYARAGFIVPDEAAGGDRLLVRPRRA